MRKKLIYILSIVIGIMMLGFSLFYYLNAKQAPEDRRPIPKRVTMIKSKPKLAEATQEKVKEISLDDIFKVEEIPLETVKIEPQISEEEKRKTIEAEIQKDLKERMSKLYKNCKKINTKKGIIKKLEAHEYKDVFLSDIYGNTFFGSNDIEDIDARTIILEEIQKIGKYSEGFIVSKVDLKGTTRYIYVKDLRVEKLFLGVDIYY